MHQFSYNRSSVQQSGRNWSLRPKAISWKPPKTQVGNPLEKIMSIYITPYDLDFWIKRLLVLCPEGQSCTL